MRFVLSLAAALCTTTLSAQEATDREQGPRDDPARVVFSTGADFESGDYGVDADLEKTAIPVAIGVAKGRVRASAQLPWVRVTAPANVIAPTGPLGLPILVDPTRPSTRTTREGVGDLRLAAAYDLPVRGFQASVGTSAKVPTASVAKGLGTGKADYSVNADVAKPLGAVTPYAGVAYTMAGDPDGFDIGNSFSGQAGATLRLGKSTSANLGYAYAQSQVDQGEDDQRLVGGLNAGIGGRLSLGVYGSSGLSDGAPDVAGGVSLGIRLGR